MRELVLPDVERHGSIEAWIIDDTGFLKKGLRIPAHRGQSFRRIADGIPVIADYKNTTTSPATETPPPASEKRLGSVRSREGLHHSAMKSKIADPVPLPRGG